ncbi:alpha/beta fold hydrolase [Melissospora conviva]|uniref:alpha/beta fold hydrolase n=1 Tax=Melissospora conviva TaxID=3388432 RepID=UPI003C23EC6C
MSPRGTADRGRLGLRGLRLSMAAPAPAGGLVSEWRLVDGISTHCRRGSDAGTSRPPVLLVHGLAVSHRYLSPLASALAVDHDVYVPDLPGFGLSGAPGTVYDAHRHADHLAAWLGAYGLGGVCVLGHSFGAEVAAALAARHPGAVGALVLAGAIADPRARTPWGQFRRFLRDAPREPLLQVPILLRDVWDAGPARVHRTLELATAHPIEADLRRLDCPTLILTGGRDPLVPPAWRAELGRIVPDARVVTVPGVAHNVVTSAAAETAAAVRAFLQPTRIR